MTSFKEYEKPAVMLVPGEWVRLPNGRVRQVEAVRITGYVRFDCVLHPGDKSALYTDWILSPSSMVTCWSALTAEEAKYVAEQASMRDLASLRERMIRETIDALNA